MSYTIEIYAAALPEKDELALTQVENIKVKEQQEQGKAHPSLRKLHAQLVKKYPCLSSYECDEEGIDDCPWADSPLIDNFGSHVAILSISNHQDEVLAHILSCAGKLQLAVIDPQEGVIYRPNSELASKFIQKQQQIAAKSQPWNKKTVERTIISYLEPMLARYGFFYKKSEESFLRKSALGGQGIGFATFNYAPMFRFGFWVYANLDGVVDLSKKIYGPDAQCDTLHTVMKYFTETKIEPEVTNSEELLTALEILAVLLEEKVIPFLDQCQDARGIDQKMNPEVLPGSDSSHQMEYRALMVAWLANNPNFLKLVDYYRDSVNAYYQKYRDHLEQTISYLLQHKNNDAHQTIQE